MINKHTRSTHKVRNSNIELLRILAIVMVLILHANYFSVGAPTHNDFVVAPFNSLVRIGFECFAIIAVNLFVLISGWFGIRTSPNGILKFLYQGIFIIGIFAIIGLILNKIEYKLDIVPNVLYQSGVWFVVSYLGLMIFAPILNNYIENVDRKQFLFFLILFFAFQTYFGWFLFPAKEFCNGYATISFIGLYMLARYMKLYGSNYLRFGLGIWLVSTGLNFVIQAFAFYTDNSTLQSLTISYCSPLIIAGALGLLMWVSAMCPTHNKIINLIAGASFAVYLIHMGNLWTQKEYVVISRTLFENENGLLYLSKIFLVFVVLFTCAICIDSIRAATWKRIERLLPDFLNNSLDLKRTKKED